MAATDTTTQAPAKKKRAAFTRTVKPVYAILSYTDEQGAVVKLDPSRLTIQMERDADKILAAALGGTVAGTVVKVDLPAPATRAKAPEAAPAA